MSRRRLILLTLAALALPALAAGAAAIRSYDFGWQVRAGSWILEHGRPPRTDPLSFTTAGRPWVDHEWLFQVMLAGLLRAGGVGAAWAGKMALTLGAVLLPAWFLLRRGHGAMAVTGLTCLALAGARFRFFARPEMAGLVLLPVMLMLLLAAMEAHDRGRSPWPRLLPVPLLAALWVNLHPSALLGVGLVLITAVVILLETRDTGRAWPFLAVGLAAAAALLANPYGGEILRVPAAIGSVLQGRGMSNPEWGTSLQPAFWLFWVVLPLLVLAAFLARRGGRSLAWPVLAWGTVLAVLGATSLRFLGFFYIVLPILVLSGWRSPRDADRSRPMAPGWGRWTGVVVPVLSLLAAGWFLAVPAGARPGRGLAPGRFPVAMASSFVDAGLQGPLYNPVRFGGYLAWALDPLRVFIDGRNELHGDLLAEMADCRAQGDIRRWDRLMDRWGIAVAILSYEDELLPVRMPDGGMVERSARAVYFRRQRWALIDWDDTAMLLVRRDSSHVPIAGFPEDRWSRPDEPGRLAADLREGRTDPGETLDAIHRQQARHPGSQRARRAEAIVREAMRQGGTDGVPPGSDNQ